MNWKMNRALEYVKSNWMWDKRPTIEAELDDIITQAKLAPQQEFEGAGDIGKTVHKWREEWMQAWFTGNPQLLPPINDDRPEVTASCKAIENCITKLQAQPLAVELYLADDELKLGGTLDDIWAVPVDTKEQFTNPGNPLDGGYNIKRKWEVWLIDLKTSNQAWGKDTYFFQVALYWAIFKKLYKIKIDKLYILHTSKTHFGEYELIPLLYPKRYLQMAKNVLRLYDDLQELKKIKRPEIAKI